MRNLNLHIDGPTSRTGIVINLISDSEALFLFLFVSVSPTTCHCLSYSQSLSLAPRLFALCGEQPDIFQSIVFFASLSPSTVSVSLSIAQRVAEGGR